jgi:hypothetical protein
VVVDVAVQGGNHVRPLGVDGAVPRVLVAVDRVGVGLGDDADAGPAGVAEHGNPRARCGESQMQQTVVPDRRPQRSRVVAQLADLGRRLVHERQDAAVGDPHRAGGVQGVLAAGREARRQLRLVELEPVVPDEEVEPGRIPSPHLQPVDR